MLKSTKQVIQILMIGCTVLYIFPTILSAQDTGHDWYCPNHEAHKEYQKHRKLHHDYAAKAIAEMVSEIFNDSSLSLEQKNAKAEKLITSELGKVKLGLGD